MSHDALIFIAGMVVGGMVWASGYGLGSRLRDRAERPVA